MKNLDLRRGFADSICHSVTIYARHCLWNSDETPLEDQSLSRAGNRGDSPLSRRNAG